MRNWKHAGVWKMVDRFPKQSKDGANLVIEW